MCAWGPGRCSPALVPLIGCLSTTDEALLPKCNNYDLQVGVPPVLSSKDRYIRCVTEQKKSSLKT